MKQTPKITAITKNVCRDLRSDLDAALIEVGHRLGLSIKVGNMRFTNTHVDIKITADVLSSTGEVVDSRTTDWPKYCNLFGFKPEHLGATIQITHGRATIFGLDLKKRKFPIIVKAFDGKMFKLSAEFARRQLGVQ